MDEIKRAAEKVEEIRKEAARLLREWFPDLPKENPREYRITLLSVMRAIIDLMSQELRVRELETRKEEVRRSKT